MFECVKAPQRRLFALHVRRFALHAPDLCLHVLFQSETSSCTRNNQYNYCEDSVAIIVRLLVLKMELFQELPHEPEKKEKEMWPNVAFGRW